jgi:hypothetical protein
VHAKGVKLVNRVFLLIVCLLTLSAVILLSGSRAVLAQCPEGTCDTDCRSYVYWDATNCSGSSCKWHELDMPVPYYINEDGAAYCTGDEFRAVHLAVGNWESVHQTYWAACYKGTTDKHSSADDATPVTDGYNVISWEDMGGTLPYSLGRAQWWWDGSKNIYEADISMNDNAAIAWSALKPDTCLAGKYELESVLTHELGHWMSFDHSCDQKATMYCYSSTGETHKRTPNDCDVTAMSYLYPQTDGVPKPQPGCWPAQFNDWITSHLALGDINRDGVEEIVFATYDSTLHVLNGRGEEIKGWPQKLPDYVDASPALADLNGDGWLEIVIGCQNESLYVFKSSGARAPNWPQEASFGGSTTPSIADLDKDGHMDIIYASDSVRVWTASSGALKEGWPVYVGGLVQRAAPALADLDSDDSLEVVIPGGNNKVYALKPHGASLPGWPQSAGRNLFETVAIGDIDGDTHYEVVATAKFDSVYAWNHNGTRCAGWPLYFTSTVGTSPPCLGNLDGDAALEVIFGSSSDTLHALNGDGTAVAGWPIRVEGDVTSSAIIVDLDNDTGYEVIAGTTLGNLYAFNGNGTPVTGWFKPFGSSCDRTPVVGDVDGNNELDVLVPDTPSHRLYAYNLGTVPGDAPYGWRMYGHDWSRTARYGFEPDVPTPILFFDTFADLSGWEALGGGGASVDLGAFSHSPPFSMSVNGSAAPGAYASAYSEYVNIDFSLPYTIKFWFSYSDFYNANWLVFGHARLRILSPTEPVFVDQAGDWSMLAPTAVTFDMICPPSTYVEFEIRVDPAYRSVALYADGLFLDSHEYFETVVPSNRIWLEDREYPGEFLLANYDDFEIHGYLPVVSVEEGISPVVPMVNVLYQSYPNPMNPSATIRYSVKETGRVTLCIYDVAGRLIRKLVDEVKQASPSSYSVVWDGRNDLGSVVASGVYFCMMEANKFSSAKKIVVLR